MPKNLPLFNVKIPFLFPTFAANFKNENNATKF